MKNFKKQFVYGCLSLALTVPTCVTVHAQDAQDKTYFSDWVNPLIGTTGSHPTEYGGRIPAVMTPFGMTQWSAMTRENGISACPYHYDDSSIIGFIGTHQPSIWMGDYGYMSFMPQFGGLPRFDTQGRGFSYSHEDEVTSPYYYSVNLQKGKYTMKVEQTATTRCGYYKITYPEGPAAHMSIQMSRMPSFEGYVKIIPEKRQIVGYNSDVQNNYGGRNMGPKLNNFKGYFVMQFDADFLDYGTYFFKTHNSPSGVVKGRKKTELKKDMVGAYLTFKKKPGMEVNVKIASSYISIEQAQQNLEKEIADSDFETVKNQCRDAWENRLGNIQIEGGTVDQRTLFYTSLANSLMYPATFSEYGKYYSPFDEKIHEGVSYNAYSLWDTFRALHPLLLLVAKDQVSPMITSLVQMYEEGGWIPKWPNPTYSNIMIGTHSDAVIADAYVKGERNFDVNKAYEAIYKNAMVAPDGDESFDWPDRAAWRAYEGRGGLTWYKQLGYVAADRTRESVSRTLEFAYDDYCVAQVAKGLGKMDDYEHFMARSKNYRNVYNPASGFMHARLSNGNFADNVAANRGFTEGSPWTYLFCAMQDVPGLVELLGGKEAFISKLDQNFREGHYRHDNEPGHHYIYLYDYVGQPKKTQKLVSEVLATKYFNAPNGLSGNDDCGQMSAWYVFSAMGFYPVCPGSDTYAIGKPLFDKITLRLGEGKNFTIKANGLSKENQYVKAIRLDGKYLEKPFITHSDLLNHEVLEFDMTSSSSEETGIQKVIVPEALANNVYNIAGLPVMENVNDSKVIQQLPKGIYIYNGEKFIVK